MDHLTPHRSIIPPHDRADRLGQNPLLIWFTGLSGAGKSTLATHVEKELFESGLVTFYLDADQVRQGINQDLGFDASSRHENMRRVGHLSKQLMDAGLIVLAGFISPFRSDRAFLREIVMPYEMVEIYLSTPFEECEKRDPKGLYKKARAGLISHFSGLTSPYEPPHSPALAIDTSKHSLAACVEQVKEVLRQKNLGRPL